MTTIDTRLGKIQGKTLGSVHAFRGIRFGQPPVGELRFKPSIMDGPWEGTYDATRHRHRSLQPPPMDFLRPTRASNAQEPTYDEDCLFLNIYTPTPDANKRPVLYWIHGGGYTGGSGYEYDGRVLANQGDVVVVTVNYRLGLLGFMDMSGFGDDYKGSANNGIGDQILGLEWVRDNIADYGGDPANVMIFGESAGAGSVNGLLAAPRADGLYHKAIAHSGNSAATPPNPIAPIVADHLGIEQQDLPDKLAGMSGEEVLAVQIATGASGGLCVDGTVVTRSTGQAIAERGKDGVPYIAGSNANEGTLFTFLLPGDDDVYGAMAHAMAKMAMDGADPGPYLEALKAHYPAESPKTHYEHTWNDLFRRASINLTTAATAAGPGGWLYRFDLPTTVEGGKLGATHACEIAFTFNMFGDSQASGIAMHDLDDPVAQELAQKWSQTVLNFAKTGDPNDGGLPAWPKYEATNRQSLVMDTQCRIADGELDAVHRKLWGN